MDEIIIQLKNYYNQCLDWLNRDPSNWIAVISAIASILALHYARKAIMLQRESNEKTIELEKERKRKAELEEKEKSKRSVPESIYFGNKILIVPSMIEAGIPKDLSYLGIFESKVKIGDWIERGEEIFTVTHRVFEEYEKPKGWFSKYQDVDFPISDSLKSPVSGLIIGFGTERVRYISSNYSSYDYYGEKEVFPIILLPKGEPPQERYITDFYDYIINMLNKNWTKLVYSNSEKGDIRLKEAKPELKYEEIPKTTIKEFEIREIELDKKDRSLLDGLQNLRAKDHVLREKLFHLVKEDE
jgi:hypothetical protein